MERNLINYHPSLLDKNIYRVMPVHRLFELFESHELTLVQPNKWDDPFENLVLAGLIDGVFDKHPAGKVFRMNIYGQCWTTHRETDAMWRIYSSDKQGVKVRCTVRNLLSSIIQNNSEFDSEGTFLGKVEYLPQKTLLSILSSIDDIYGLEAARSLMYKRREFKHESEVRLVYTRAADEVKKLVINPQEVFDEIIFDPRMNEHIYESYSQSVLAKGFKGRVAKSTMYQLPIGLIKSPNKSSNADGDKAADGS
jgi:hypothetical protein